MSGFAGIINFSAKIQDDNNFMLMVDELVSHPHKATSSFSNNHAKIFHAELNFKEASSKQNSIFYCSMSEKLVLFYGRIDNKDEISLITKERHLEAKQCFILHKLHKEKFHKYLQGSWVLVIIDFVNKTLISYKDHIGSKPFFFIKKESTLIFSTSLNALFRAYTNQLTHNTNRIKDYLINLYGDEHQTFFNEIIRLGKGERLYFNNGKHSTTKYFCLDEHKIDRYNSIDDCIESFYELFTLIIKQQSHGIENLGSKLSGGLDSSAITSLLARYCCGNLTAFSAIFKNLNQEDFTKTDERKYMEDVANYRNINHKFVEINADTEDPMQSMLNSSYVEPIPHANRYFEKRLLEATCNNGIKVLFDGFDGDTVLSYGHEYLFELGRNLDLYNLIMQGKKWNKRLKIHQIIKQYLLIHFLPDSIYKKLSLQKNLTKNFPMASILNTETYKDYKVDKNLPKNKLSVQSMHKQSLDWRMWDYAMDFSYTDTIECGIEERYPFFDKRLMQFCLAVPGKFRIKDGVTRYYFRKAMENDLPTSVLQRLSKANISPLISIKLNNYLNENSNLKFLENIDEYIDINKAKTKIIEPYLKGTNQRYLGSNIYSLIALSNWKTKLTKN